LSETASLTPLVKADRPTRQLVCNSLGRGARPSNSELVDLVQPLRFHVTNYPKDVAGVSSGIADLIAERIMTMCRYEYHSWDNDKRLPYWLPLQPLQTPRRPTTLLFYDADVMMQGKFGSW